MIPFGPTKGDKDGAWRGGAAFAGLWAILWFLGVLTPLPIVVLDMTHPVGSFVIAFALLGAFMSLPYAWRWLSGNAPRAPMQKGPVLVEVIDSDGKQTHVYHPDGPGGWSPPLNKGIGRSISSRTTIWREVSWVAPVTVGDVILTAFWNVVGTLMGRMRNRRSTVGTGRSYDDGMDDAGEL